MSGQTLAKGFWTPMRPSSPEQLKALEEESYSEGVRLRSEKPDKADEALKALVMQIDIRKIMYDIYVWQRVDAVKRGIFRAQEARKQ